MKAQINRLITNLILSALKRMQTPTYRAIIRDSLQSRVDSLPPEDALKLLFWLDNHMYLMEGNAAVRYGDGRHTKHRHTRYFDFFVANISQGARVLDIGSHQGYVAHELATRCDATVTGVEINPQHLAYAQEHYTSDRVEFIGGDILTDGESTLAEREFDVVLLSNVLEHLTNRPQLLENLREWTGASRFLIRVPTFERDWRVPLKKELGLDWRLDDDHETEFTLESFQEETMAAGLKIEHLEVRWGEIWSVLGVT